MAKFQFTENLLDGITQTVRAHDTLANPLTANDVGKFVKMTGDSQYGLCASGDEIEGTFTTHESPKGTYDGYTLGAVTKGGRRRVTFGAILDIGDFVVAGTVVARGTSLAGAYPTVLKESTAGAFRWRVVARDGTTAVGQTGIIECVTGAGTGTNAG